jgi:hypothetical protein
LGQSTARPQTSQIATSGVLNGEFAADELVGHDAGIAVAATSAAEELVDRGQVTGAAAPSTAAANQPAAGPGAMPTLLPVTTYLTAARHDSGELLPPLPAAMQCAALPMPADPTDGWHIQP